MKINQFLIALFTIVPFVQVIAQSTPDAYNTRLNYIFAKVDHSKVTTGLLCDYGIQVIPPDYYDGTLRDSNEVDINAWRTLYGGMYSSRFNSISVLPSQTNVFDAIAQNMPSINQPVPLAVMCINYNRLRTDAYTAGLVSITNEQLYDVAGKNPYETKTLFAAAPLQTGFTSLTVQFILKFSLYFTNSSKTVTSMNVDPGDGNGFRAISWNSQFSVTYHAYGNKAFIVKFTFSDGTTLQTHSKIAIISDPTLKSNSTFRYIVSTDPNLIHPIPATSLHSGGTVNVALSYQNNTGKIQKPIIVVKGWDPWKIFNDPTLHITIKTFLENFLDKDGQYIGLGCIEVPINSQIGGGTLEGYLNDNGYDIVFLDYNDGTDDIKRNSKLLKDAIKWVNDNKVGTQANVVLGISMGGLVARWALREMENEGKDHQTVKLITMDSPHKGANIPVGVQAALYHASSLGFSVGIPGLVMVEVASLSDIVSQLKQAMQVLNAPASKQMLIYKVAMYPNGDLYYDNSIHDAFQAEYDALGMPLKCQNIAISDGAGNGTTYFSPNAELINYSANYSLTFWQEMLNIVSSGFTSSGALFTNYPQLAINIIPGKTEIKGECIINAIPSQSGRVYHARLYVTKKILWLIPVNVDITNCNLNSENNMVPIDGVPGGGINVDYFIGQTSLPTEVFKQKIFCFVPAVSALALKDWKTYLTTNLNVTNFIGNGQTPFDSYFSTMPTTNFEHTQFNSSADYILAKFANCPDILPDASIIGTKYVCSTGSTFTITNLPSGCKVSWNKSSNITLSSASGNSATFTANGNGSGWVSATINSGCDQTVLSQKPVWVGAPNNLSISGSISIKKGIIKTWSIQNASSQSVTGYNWYTDGGIIPTGSTTSSTFQAKGVGCGLDVITCELTNTCGTGSNPSYLDVEVICIQAAENISINIYPQPANNTLNVELVNDSIGDAEIPATFPEYELKLLNRNSNVLLTEKINSKFKTIDISKLRSGVYILQIIHGEFIESRTIIITK